jgi:2-keto-4-pentenoate hydratase/2-oxohepta-3-ene-1,7-dioic acid hydratase in catechol pathway
VPLLIDTPGKVIAIGVNYRRHAEEMGYPLTGNPMVFGHFTTALIGPGDPIVLPHPDIDAEIDYEGELGVVIGERAKHVPESEALGIVRGYCCANDVSARGLQRSAGGNQMTMGKSLDTFDPVGALTPAAQIPDPQALRIRTLLNGEVVQDSTTAQMIFSVASLIAYITRTVTLEPGDLIITGSPEKVGTPPNPRRFMRDGDEVTVEIEGLAPLTNPVRAGR